MRRWSAITILLLAISSAASAQSSLPPGRWWRRPEIVQTLNLSEEQQNHLETIFRSSADDLIDRRAEVEKLNIALRSLLDSSQLDRTAILRTAAKLNEARGRLFDRELTMLVDMRAVLNDAQWSRMRNELDRMRANSPKAQQRRQRP